MQAIPCWLLSRILSCMLINCHFKAKSRLRSCLKIVGFVLVAMASIAQAKTSKEQCTPVEGLQEKLGPIRDQSDVGWCYANTAADMLTAYYDTSKMGYMSVLQLAIIYNLSWETSLNFFDGGSVARTLKTALRTANASDRSQDLLKFGFCPESLESEEMSMGPQSALSLKVGKLMDLKTSFDLGRFDLVKNQIFRGKYLNLLSQGGFVDAIPEQSLYQALEKSTPGNFLLHFSDLLCGARRFYNSNKDLNVITHMKTGTTQLKNSKGELCTVPVEFDLVKDVHRQLDQKNLVAASLSMELIKAGGDLERGRQVYSGHALSVVDRRWQNGSCQLKLRNSWGSKCDIKIDESQKTSRYSKYIKECDQGYLWVNESDFLKASENISYLSVGQDQFPQVIPLSEANHCPQH
jgi:predicted metal-dependent HD superfamily phosphohydrolase